MEAGGAAGPSAGGDMESLLTVTLMLSRVVCVCLCVCAHAYARAQSLRRVRLCDPMDCSPPGSSVHGTSQAKILEWAAMPSSRGPSQSRDQTPVSHIAGRFFTI